MIRPTPAAVLLLMALCLPFAAAATAQVSYVESSSGLDTPKLDGGYTEVEMVDVNADGKLDLLSVGDHGNPHINTDQHGVIVWFGNGRGRWQPFQFGTFGYGGIAAGDLNGDGKMDVAYGIHHNYSGQDLGDSILEAALGDGTGRAWTAWDDGLATNGETYGMFSTDLADVDGDGDLDLASISFGCCAGVHVYLNGGDGTWSQSFGFLGGNNREDLVFGDVNGDGWPDLAVSHSQGTVLLGDGNGSFAYGDANLPPGGNSGRLGVSLGDVNGDGRDDLAWARSGGLAVWVRNVDGTWSDFSGGLPAVGSWEATQLRDMDGDGIPDLAAFGNGRAGVWIGNGDGTWAPAAMFSTPAPGYFEAFRVGGDADHNGLPDIAIVDEEGGPFNSRNHLHFFRERSVPLALKARLVQPGPHATLRTGSVRFVEWTSAVPVGAPPGRVSLAYSLTGVSGPWTVIAKDLPDTGRYQWNVPERPPTDDLRLGVQVISGANRARAVSAPLTLAVGRRQ